MTVGSLSQKTAKKSFGTIGASAVRLAQAAPAPSVKPWDSDVFAPEPIKPNPNSVDRQKPAPKKEKKRPQSTINKAADRQLGVLEDEGY